MLARIQRTKPSGVFWSQAVVAEVYALNALFVAAILLVVGREMQDGGRWTVDNSDGRNKSLSSVPSHSVLALLFGLALTHHRTIILLAPALALWLIAEGRRQTANAKGSLRQWLVAALAPLLLYLYLPLRGVVGSLDSTYQ
ncbi:MAG: DUF2723 domain-containing protein, partial [Chloroflexi bacterium]|nr:DUF2723 domain-containing protein [Chloroflexota bacterium]